MNVRAPFACGLLAWLLAGLGERIGGARCLRRKHSLAQVFFIVVVALFPTPRTLADGAKTAAIAPDIVMWGHPACPHCRAAHRFLDDLRRKRPELVIVEHDVTVDLESHQSLRTLLGASDSDMIGFPSFVVRGAFFMGFDSALTTGTQIERMLDSGRDEPERKEPRGTQTKSRLPREANEPNDDAEIDLPLVGRVNAHELGLPLFTVVIGLIDGFNPCAMWVLLFLLSLLVNVKSRSRMLAIAGTFVVVSGLAYFAFMAAWLNVFMLVGLSRIVQIVLGVVALVIGAVNIKDYFALGRGISFSIPERAKPGIYARVRKIVRAESLLAAIVGAIVLAVLVNVVELVCTAGLPALYTHVLVQQGVSTAGRYAYLALYNLAYMFDDGVMVGIAVVTLGQKKLQERAGSILKLVSGLVITLLGLALLFAPDALVW